MTRRELGEKYFKEGYNCAQSVALAFKDLINVDEKTLLMLCSSFGGGMGRLREVCGAVSGLFIVVGLKEGYYDNHDIEGKKAHYQKVQHLAGEFKKINGSYVCRELLNLNEQTSAPTPEARTNAYYKKRPCTLLVGDACEILENYFNKN